VSVSDDLEVVEAEARKAVTSPLKRASARRAALRHGRRAETLSPEEVRVGILRKVHRDAPEVLQAAADAIKGDYTAYERIGFQALAEAEILRRAGVEGIQKRGVMVKEVRTEQDGSKTERWKANPLLDHVRRLHAVLGFTAEEMQLTKKARGQGAKDAAVTRVLERAAMLREASRSTPMLPAPAIDVTVVE
jgi:hypothetical protein